MKREEERREMLLVSQQRRAEISMRKANIQKDKLQKNQNYLETRKWPWGKLLAAMGGAFGIFLYNLSQRSRHAAKRNSEKKRSRFFL